MFSNHPQQPKQPLPQYSGREYIMLQLRNIGRREPTGLPPMVFCLLENGWHSNGFHASGRKLCRCLSEYIYSVRLFFVSSPPVIYSSPPASVSPPAVLSSLSKTARPTTPPEGDAATPLPRRGRYLTAETEKGRDRPRTYFSKLPRSREGGFSRHINSGGIKR